MLRSIRLVGVLLIVFALALGGRGVAGVAAQSGGPTAGDAPAAPAAAVIGTGFTYQGQLDSGGSPYTGTCDFNFDLYDGLNGGAHYGVADYFPNTTVTDGKFTVTLNTGGQFGNHAIDGGARWLAIAVRCPTGVGALTLLTPRQPLTAAPYALGLRPGADMEGNTTEAQAQGAALKVVLNDTTRGVWVILHDNNSFFDDTSSAAVVGESDSQAGVFGFSADARGVGGYSHTDDGVYGYTDSTTGVGAGVHADGAGNGTKSVALEVSDGGLRVPGAGANSTTPLFIQKVITGGGGNVCAARSYATVIDYPLINGVPGAILVVTPNYGGISGGTAPAVAIPAVYYDNTNECGHGTGHWVIYNLSTVTLSNNQMFNVFAVIP